MNDNDEKAWPIGNPLHGTPLRHVAMTVELPAGAVLPHSLKHLAALADAWGGARFVGKVRVVPEHDRCQPFLRNTCGAYWHGPLDGEDVEVTHVCERPMDHGRQHLCACGAGSLQGDDGSG